MWFAQEATPSPIELVQYGAIGIVLIGFVLGWIWAKPAVERLLKDNDRLVEDFHKKVDTLIDEVRQLRTEVKEIEQTRSRSHDSSGP